MHSGLHSYLALGNAFRFTIVFDTQQCTQVYTHAWHSAVHPGLHSCLTLSSAFRSTFVLDTQQCIQVYTRTLHSAVQSAAVDQTVDDPFNGVFVQHLQILAFIVYLLMVSESYCRSQLPRGLRRRSAAARLLRSWVRIPPGAWIFVCCECCRVEVSATSWSLVQRSPTDCGMSVCVI